MATRNSEFGNRRASDGMRLTMRTATDAVMRLLALDSPNDMISIGAMKETPPIHARTSRAIMSTYRDMLLGSLLITDCFFRQSFSPGLYLRD
jgi:hypothetical protein